MKPSLLSLAHSGVVPSVCDAEAGEAQHDPAFGVDLDSMREAAWAPPDRLEMDVHWYSFWKRTPKRTPGRATRPRNVQ